MLALFLCWSWRALSLFCFWHHGAFCFGSHLCIFKIFVPPPSFPQFSSASSVLFSPLLSYSTVLFKELLTASRNTRNIWHVQFIHFHPGPKKGLCMQSNNLFQEGFVYIFTCVWCYICYVLGWKEINFLTVFSFHGSLLCRLRNLSSSCICCIMFFIKSFSLEEIQLCLPLPCIFPSHSLQNT